MKILTLHANYIKFKPVKKALQYVEDVEEKETEVKECLVVLTAVEKQDEDNTELIVKKLVDNIKDIASQIKTHKIVLYPYAHLSSKLALPEKALQILKHTEESLKKDFEVTRAPFGYYKQFTIDVKGHPLAELSREISVETKETHEQKTKTKVSKISYAELSENDHRKIGQRMDLFMMHEYSPGSPFFLPKGTIIYNELVNFIRQLYKKFDYQEIITPQIYNKTLWDLSGHWKYFKDNLFVLEMDNNIASLKPMNCPGHVLIFKSKIRSYKDLPIRYADFSFLHRNELTGVLGGLTRLRKFSQDDAHVFCTEEQIEHEIMNILEFINIVYSKTFKMKFTARLSTRPDKAMGDIALWNKAEKILESSLKKSKMKYVVKEKEGAFYGPKIDIDVKDSSDREWQLATIQLDFQMPLNMEATYEGNDGKKHNVVMIHRAVLGSLERFIALLIENYKGKFPLWLAPVQVKVLTLTERNKKFAEKVYNELKENNIRVELDDSSSTIDKKIRESQLENINYMVTIGDKETQNKTLAVRTLNGKVKFGVSLDKFTNSRLKEIEEKE